MKDNFPIRLREQNALLPEQDTVLARFKQLILGGGDAPAESVEAVEDAPETIEEPVSEGIADEEETGAEFEEGTTEQQSSTDEGTEADGEANVVEEDAGISEDDTVLFEDETIVDNDDASWFEPDDDVDAEQ